MPQIPLERNPDILVDLVRDRVPGQTIVGFAAETGDAEGTVLEYGRIKLAKKGCDLLVVNEVGHGKAFGQRENSVTILSADGSEFTVPLAAKEEVSHRVWDSVLAWRGPAD